MSTRADREIQSQSVNLCIYLEESSIHCTMIDCALRTGPDQKVGKTLSGSGYVCKDVPISLRKKYSLIFPNFGRFGQKPNRARKDDPPV